MGSAPGSARGSTGGEARDYLADDFEEQAAGSTAGNARGYRVFAEYLRGLPGADGRVAELSELLRPFLEDNPRVGGTLYPDGDAIRFMDSFVPGEGPADCEEYFDEFLVHLRTDHRRWLAHVAARGADAEWTLEKGRPSVGVCPLHLEKAPTTVPPLYESWAHYLTATTPAERRAMSLSGQEGQCAPSDV